MLKKVLTIFTSVIVMIVMMTDIVLPVYAIKGNISARPPLVEPGIYNMQSMVGNNMFVGVQTKLDNTGYNYDDNGVVQLYKKSNFYYKFAKGEKVDGEYGSLNQQFYFWYDPYDGYYTIIPMHTFASWNLKCIGIRDANGGVGTKVKQCNMSFRDNCKWAIKKTVDGKYEFTLKSNGLRLEVSQDKNKINGLDCSGPLLQINSKDCSDSQRFTLRGVRCRHLDKLKLDKSRLNTLQLDTLQSHVSELRACKDLDVLKFDSKCKKITNEQTSVYENAKIVNIPSSVEEITDDAFSSCDNITAVICDPKWLCKFKKESLNAILLQSSTGTGNFNITEEVFEGYEKLQEIWLLEGVTKIPARAFKDCKKLKKVVISKSVEEIDTNAFSGCDSLFFDNIICSENQKEQFDPLYNKVKETIKILQDEGCNDYKIQLNIMLPVIDSIHILHYTNADGKPVKICDKGIKFNKELRERFRKPLETSIEKHIDEQISSLNSNNITQPLANYIKENKSGIVNTYSNRVIKETHHRMYDNADKILVEVDKELAEIKTSYIDGIQDKQQIKDFYDFYIRQFLDKISDTNVAFNSKTCNEEFESLFPKYVQKLYLKNINVPDQIIQNTYQKIKDAMAERINFDIGLSSDAELKQAIEGAKKAFDDFQKSLVNT